MHLENEDDEESAKLEIKINENLKNLKIDHSNIIKYFGSMDFEEKNNQTSETMRLKLIFFECGIKSVDNLIFKKKEFFVENFQDLKNLVNQLFSALVYLRIMKIGHRDIKPQNIIYFIEQNSKKLYFKLADFGIGTDLP